MRNIIFVVILLFSTCFAYANDKVPVVLTSQPDYNVMALVTSNYTLYQSPIVEPKTFKYTSYFDAYGKFDKYVMDSIKNAANQSNYDGVCNYQTKVIITDKMYYFEATYDFWRYKN